MGMALAAVAAYTFYRSLSVFFMMLPMAGAYPIYWKQVLLRRRSRELSIQFKEGILMLSASLRAGYSIENALTVSGRELELLYGTKGMIHKEFAYMVEQMSMNRTVEIVMMDFAKRSGLEDVENFAGIFAAAKRSGGQLVPVIQHTASAIQDKLQIQEEIRTLTASKQFEQKIMNLIPFLIIIYIDGTSPGFFNMMYNTWWGRGLMSCCLAVYVFAYTLSQRILSIS